jgi:hypothetical protein
VEVDRVRDRVTVTVLVSLPITAQEEEALEE